MSAFAWTRTALGDDRLDAALRSLERGLTRMEALVARASGHVHAWRLALDAEFRQEVHEARRRLDAGEVDGLDPDQLEKMLENWPVRAEDVA